ncbi:MAG: hypothetical protein JOY79_02970 [Acidobacteriaceae bacterium]|nr:hypothetical protein [Acidobacteriaceae bacterium]
MQLLRRLLAAFEQRESPQAQCPVANAPDYCIIAGGGTVAKKGKRKTFRAVTAVKAAAREHIGTPPPTRRLPDPKKQKQEKHKPTLGGLLSERD